MFQPERVITRRLVSNSSRCQRHRPICMRNRCSSRLICSTFRSILVRISRWRARMWLACIKRHKFWLELWRVRHPSTRTFKVNNQTLQVRITFITICTHHFRFSRPLLNLDLAFFFYIFYTLNHFHSFKNHLAHILKTFPLFIYDYFYHSATTYVYLSLNVPMHICPCPVGQLCPQFYSARRTLPKFISFFLLTGASSSRVVSSSSISPQGTAPPRGLAIQAGLPVPAYEASLVSSFSNKNPVISTNHQSNKWLFHASLSFSLSHAFRAQHRDKSGFSVSAHSPPPAHQQTSPITPVPKQIFFF